MFCHDFRCDLSVKWWVIKRDSGRDLETCSWAELIRCMQQAGGVCFCKKLHDDISTQTPAPTSILKKVCFYSHWLMTVGIQLAPQSSNSEHQKKQREDTLWTFISWRKLLRLKTSKAIPGRETLTENNLGFSHTHTQIWKCVWVRRNNQLDDKKANQKVVYRNTLGSSYLSVELETDKRYKSC